jgi:hypothetical protein
MLIAHGERVVVLLEVQEESVDGVASVVLGQDLSEPCLLYSPLSGSTSLT